MLGNTVFTIFSFYLNDDYLLWCICLYVLILFCYTFYALVATISMIQNFNCKLNFCKPFQFQLVHRFEPTNFIKSNQIPIWTQQIFKNHISLKKVWVYWISHLKLPSQISQKEENIKGLWKNRCTVPINDVTCDVYKSRSSRWR